MNFWLKSLVVLALISSPYQLSPQQSSTRDELCMKLLETALVDRSKINSGSTRGEIEIYFTQDGGLQFRGTTRYVYLKSSYIHLDVEFEASDETARFSPSDKATNISKLYLDYSAKD